MVLDDCNARPTRGLGERKRDGDEPAAHRSYVREQVNWLSTRIERPKAKGDPSLSATLAVFASVAGGSVRSQGERFRRLSFWHRQRRGGMLAPRRAATSPSWHCSGSCLIRRAIQSSPPSQRGLPPSRSGLTCYAEQFPHAETSAAGAARYRRIFGDSAHPVPQGRPYTTSSALSAPGKGSRHTKVPTVLAPHHRETKPSRSHINRELLKQDPLRDTALDDTAWATPEDMLHKDPQALTGLHPRIDSCVRWQDRDLISRSSQASVLLNYHQFVESLLREVPKSSSTERLRLENGERLDSAMQSLLSVASNQSIGPSSDLSSLRDDAIALKIVFTAIIQAQLGLGVAIHVVEPCIKRIQDLLGPIPMPLYHRAISAAGKARLYDSVGRLVDLAAQSWGNRADAWLISAQYRASICGGSERYDQKRLQQLFSVARPAPLEAYTATTDEIPGGVVHSSHHNHPASEAPHGVICPPRYLFISLLGLQAYANSRKLRPSEICKVLSDMQEAGHEIDGDVWWTLSRSSLNLRLPLALIVQDARADLRTATQGGDRILIKLFHDRAEKLAVRDTMRLSLFMGLNLDFLTRYRDRAPGSIAAESATHSVLTSSRKAHFYSIAAEMFGRMARPDRALAALRNLTRLPRQDIPLYALDRAVIGVLRGFNQQGLAGKAITLGLDFIGETDRLSGWDGPRRFALTETMLSAMMRSASLLPTYRDKVRAVRGMMPLGIKYNIAPSSELYRALASFMFAAIGRDERYVDEIWALMTELQDISTGKGGAEHPALDTTQRSRLRRFLYILTELGFEDHVGSVARRRVWWETQRAARWDVRYGERIEQESVEWVRREDYQSDISRSTLANEEASFSSAESEVQSSLNALAPHARTEGTRQPDDAEGPHTEPDQARGNFSEGRLGADQADVKGFLAEGEFRREMPPHQQAMTRTSRKQKFTKAEQLDHEQLMRSQAKPATTRPPRIRARDREPRDPIDPQLKREMQRPLSAAAYALRLRLYAVDRGDHRSASYIYQSMLAHGIRPSMLHLSPIIEGLAMEGQIDEARAIADSTHKRFGHLAPARAQAAIVRALVKFGREQEAEQCLTEWSEAGGIADDYLLSLLSPVPALADPAKARDLFARAIESSPGYGNESSEIKLADVDEAYIYLWQNSAYYSAQKVAVLALEAGVRPDTEFKRRISAAGNYLRKLLKRRGITPDEGNYGDVSMGDSDNEHADNELSMPAIVDAYALNCQARYLAFQVIEPIQKREAQERREYLQEVKALILDFVQGKWSRPSKHQTADDDVGSALPKEAATLDDVGAYDAHAVAHAEAPRQLIADDPSVDTSSPHEGKRSQLGDNARRQTLVEEQKTQPDGPAAGHRAVSTRSDGDGLFSSASEVRHIAAIPTTHGDWGRGCDGNLTRGGVSASSPGHRHGHHQPPPSQSSHQQQSHAVWSVVPRSSSS
ncbi:unnamed protein product [Parajaminaea phylloscopi]